MDKDKLWLRAKKIGNAELLEFQRYIENKALREDVRKLRAGASLPVTLTSNKVFFEDPVYKNWMGWDDLDKDIRIQKNKRRMKVRNEVGEMLRKYEIPLHFFGSLFNFVVTGKSSNTFQTKGFPEFIHGPDKFESYDFAEWDELCIITPETDLGNPLVLENIREWQRLSRNEPPTPIKMGKEKDWRPTWEWRNRNPSVTVDEIAKMLGLNRVTVNRAFNKLDKANALQNGSNL